MKFMSYSLLTGDVGIGGVLRTIYCLATAKVVGRIREVYVSSKVVFYAIRVSPND